MNPKITIVCCYNNFEQYSNELVYGLSKQNEDYVLIGIDNCNNRYTSCSKAYNSVMEQIKTEYTIYAHQDIILEDPDFLNKYIKILDKYENAIVGVAGIDLLSKKVVSNIRHRKTRDRVVKEVMDGPKKSETIDECFFGGKTTLFQKYRFNEDICNGWHLYAVELCLRIRRDNRCVYTCDLPLVHTSGGRVSYDYLDTLFKLCELYRKDYSHIYTTCSQCETDYMKCALYVLKRRTIIFLSEVKHGFITMVSKRS